MRVGIVGDSGLLGQALVKFWAPTHDVFGVSTSLFDDKAYKHDAIDVLISRPEFFKKVKEFRLDLLVNSAAHVDLAGCERNPALAAQLNTELPGALAGFCQNERISFIHISTDQVFDGKEKNNYTENHPTSPLNNYGLSKLKGEEEVAKTNSQALIVRTNIVGFRGKASKPVFAEWLCKALYEKEPIKMADDFITSSIHVRDLAVILDKAYEKRLTGLYHAATRDSASKYDFGQRLAAELGLSFSSVQKCKLADLGLSPQRPPNLALNVEKIEKALRIQCPEIKDTIRHLAADFKLHFSKEHQNAQG